MRHKRNKAVAFRSENFLKLSPLSEEISRINEFSTLCFCDDKNLQKRGDAEISYEVKVQCGKFYYGEECSIFCNPTVGRFHFKCSPYGHRLCEDGWSGQNCDDPICANGCIHGYCISPGICKCRSGWQGENCNQCKSQEGCQHGYCNKPNECICEKNWGGTFCDRDLDYCFHNSPCLNGGKCSSAGLQNYYYCNCTNGFTGKNCEKKVESIAKFKFIHQIDPCSAVNCGKYGRCIALWNSENNYKCECDGSHYGDHCQYQTHDENMKGGSCKLSNWEYMENGFSWLTVDCRFCSCHMSKIRCSEKKCEPRDCYRNDSESGQPVSCPKDQRCVIITQDECLKGDCSYPRGRCFSWSQLNSAMLRRICQHSSKEKINIQGCARMNLEFNLQNLPSGTTSGDVCYHLLLDASIENITHIGFECKLITPNTVQVDIVSYYGISLKLLFNIELEKEFLKNRLQNHLTSSQILAAIVRIDSTDNSESNENSIMKSISTVQNSEVASAQELIPLSSHQMLVIITCLMLLIVFILLNICILKNPYLCGGRRFMGSVELLELQSEPKGHYSVSTFLDSGIIDQESQENEYNARVLEQERVKAKAWTLRGSLSDDAILNPMRLQTDPVRPAFLELC
ncbi:unnamed protein product [Thelazia callipaeda]|uniref:Delta-like protein n=1 Tax=Thelazia callipaeda TaxID=103827 RepID=A0A0N5CQI5_THECL|nr:unnamed protein product [Thelazia callipaeda]